MKNITKNTLTLAVLAACAVSPAFALEKLSDEKLAKATGQDGITITYQGGGTLGIDKIRLIDKDGLLNADGTAVNLASQDYNKAGGVELDLTGNVQFCSNDTSSGGACTLSTAPTVITVDTDGGGTSNSAFVNVGVQMGAKSIHAPKTDINLVGYGSAGAGFKKVPTQTVKIATLEDGVKIHSDNQLNANLQLGSQPQGAMMLIAPNPKGFDVDLGNITLYSYNKTPNVDSKISTNVYIQGISKELTNADGTKTTPTGTAINIDGTDGIVMTKGVATVQKVDIKNTVLGKLGAATTTNVKADQHFNNLPNAAIGNISLENIKINNLKVGVKGM